MDELLRRATATGQCAFGEFEHFGDEQLKNMWSRLPYAVRKSVNNYKRGLLPKCQQTAKEIQEDYWNKAVNVEPNHNETKSPEQEQTDNAAHSKSGSKRQYTVESPVGDTAESETIGL